MVSVTSWGSPLDRFHCRTPDRFHVHVMQLSYFRSSAAKSGWQGGGDRGVAMPARKKKRKCEDQVDVFDHLATLHRKQRVQMEM